MAIRAPRRASSTAMARPSRFEDPVTKANLPLIFITTKVTIAGRAAVSACDPPWPEDDKTAASGSLRTRAAEQNDQSLYS